METKPLLSVIICSISPEKARATVDNFQATAGIPCEFIVVDNRERKWPIAKAYNYGASQAKASCLFFAHEDILFETPGWGKPLVEKLSEKETGVIGFIGSQLRTAAYSPWCQDSNYAIGHLYFNEGGFRKIVHQGMRIGEMFRPAVVVDGLGMLVRKEVWQEFPFDEENLTGFHCYDIDFCLGVLPHYRNYVYFGADICHYSNGNMNLSWAEATIALTDRKWSRMLPVAVDEGTEADLEEISATMDYDFVRKAVRNTSVYPKAMAKKLFRRYLGLAMSKPRYRKHLPTLLWQYSVKRLGRG